MSRQWNKRAFHGARPVGRCSGSRIGARDIRLMIFGGIILGLGIASYDGGWDADEAVSDFAGVAVPDYYAESKRSKAILEAQEGAPPSAYAGSAGGGAVTVGAAGEVDVIDGDTFHYAGDRIRIADIDTPEVNGRCAYESRLAARATERLAVLLAAGPFDLQPIGRDTDQYGRKLRIVTRSGHSIGDQLVSEGLARTWTGRREPWC